MISCVNTYIPISQRHKYSIIQIENGIHGTNMLYLNLVLLNPNVVSAIVDMDTTILCSQPHS